jgi:hypothetical protein
MATPCQRQLAGLYQSARPEFKEILYSILRPRLPYSWSGSIEMSIAVARLNCCSLLLGLLSGCILHRFHRIGKSVRRRINRISKIVVSREQISKAPRPGEAWDKMCRRRDAKG